MSHRLPSTASTTCETGLGIVATDLFPTPTLTAGPDFDPWTPLAVSTSAEPANLSQSYWYDGLCHTAPTPTLYGTTQIPAAEYEIPVSRDQQPLGFSHMSVCSAPCSYMSLAPAVAVTQSSQLQEPFEYTQPIFNISPYSVSSGHDSLQSYTTSTFSTPSFAFSQAPTPPMWLTPQSQISSGMLPPSVVPDNKLASSNVFNRPGKRSFQQYSSKSLPGRKKPRLRPSLSDSHVMHVPQPARLRAASVGPHGSRVIPPNLAPRYTPQQLSVPPLMPSMLISAPASFPLTPFCNTAAYPSYAPATSYQGYHTAQLPSGEVMISGSPASHLTPMFGSLLPAPSTSLLPPPPPSLAAPMTSTPHYAERPAVSTPPSVPGYPEAIYQPPSFPGDIYTAPYKRRHPQGHWEGYCHLCDPPRWLDLKNSRYWDDKQRNHGICARTKRAFQDPIATRWIDGDGQIVCPDLASSSGIGIGGDDDDEGTDEVKEQTTAVSEGLCGVCGLWVAMQGSRSKEKGKITGWWVHAYKCHDHERDVREYRDHGSTARTRRY